MKEPTEQELEDALEIELPPQLARGSFQRIGNCYGFGFNANGEPRFTIGPHCRGYLGPLFVCMFSTILLIGLLMIIEVASEISPWAVVIGICVIGGCLSCFTAAAAFNPGIVLQKADPESNSENRNFCPVCEVLREPGTMHCSDCDVCVRGFDHHCPWTGKCIGQGNLPYFYGFLFGVMGSILFVVLCATMRTAMTGTQRH